MPGVMASSRPKQWIISGSAISAVALWGLAFPLTQDALTSFSPIMLGFLRFAIASAIFGLFMLLTYSLSEIRDTIMKERWSLLLLGALYVTIPNITQNYGLVHGTSSVASVIQSSGPVTTLLFAVLLLRERMTSMKVIGSAVAMAGTVLLVAHGNISLEDESFVSNLLIFISATSYGLAWVSAKKMMNSSPPILIIGLALVFGTAMLALALPFEQTPVTDFTLSSIANLLILGIFCAGLSSWLYLRSLEHEEVSRMAFFIYLMPVFASAFAWIIRDEGVAMWTALCAVVIVIGIIIAERSPRTIRASGK